MSESQESIPPAVKTLQLSRYYGTLAAVDHLDLTILPNQIFGLLGPNGAGKSTTIKMLTTLLQPTSGSAFVAGFDVTADPSMCAGESDTFPSFFPPMGRSQRAKT